ncbi:30S ribosomal protein S3 [candidate division WOR-3 bacterium RBG_13_43_14]|uniref:Small ribosomal subunit protein uS3 n=1 Tax=candidate division WOR-3 bacterium RBG_13_43_14 TaxID=1802590 RepID=A0A1F4UDQ7_UNCW3|nr:MAG: 30S ribosomal protein S3 [candidate division WOR-3 bacterium RBG_13_43_14]
MGQKTHPIGFRLGITKEWKSKWFDTRKYHDLVAEDYNVRRYLYQRLSEAMISDIIIRRLSNRVIISIHTAQPGKVIGKGGEEIKKLREEIKSLINKDITINIDEIRMPELDAFLVAQNISRQITQRVSHRRAMKRAIISAMKIGAKGIKVMCAGRLNGAEIARTEWSREGRVPLQTLTADIDYAGTTAYTIYGTVGIKVWIYKGTVQ